MIEKLDAFIRTYHRNAMLRGLLLSFATLVLGGGLLVAMESLIRFGVAGRTVLFYAFAATAVVVLCVFVVWPMLQWLRLGKGLTYTQAAKIVGDHFPDVKDKLLNTLQLQEQVAHAAGADVSLLAASIDQRTEALRPLSFVKAIDARPLLRWLRVAVPVGAVLSCVVFLKPAWVTEPTTRLVQHRTEFVEPAPFQFNLLNESLAVGVGEALVLDLEVVGDDLPGSVTIETMGGRFRMERLGNGRFRHSFPSVRSALSFQFLANGWRSASYDVIPFAIPSIAHMKVVATRLPTPARPKWTKTTKAT